MRFFSSSTPSSIRPIKAVPKYQDLRAPNLAGKLPFLYYADSDGPMALWKSRIPSNVVVTGRYHQSLFFFSSLVDPQIYPFQFDNDENALCRLGLILRGGARMFWERP